MVQKGVATRERLDKCLAGWEVDPELVGEVDDPLGRGTVIELLETFPDGLPGARRGGRSESSPGRGRRARRCRTRPRSKNHAWDSSYHHILIRVEEPP